MTVLMQKIYLQHFLTIYIHVTGEPGSRPSSLYQSVISYC